MDRDAEHVRLLSIFHYVAGGMQLFFGCFFIFHVVVGLLIINNPASFFGSNHHQADPPPAFLGWFFLGMGLVAITVCWTMGALVIFAGRCLGRRKNYMFCLVMAGVGCLFVPFGTVLGIFTIIVLQRPAVREMFNSQIIVK